MSELRLPTCAAHGVGSRVTCSSCGAPICLRCQVQTAGGLECPSCAASDASQPAPPPEVSPERQTSPPVVELPRPGRRRPVVALVVGAGLVAAALVVLRLGGGTGTGVAHQGLGAWETEPGLTALRGPTA